MTDIKKEFIICSAVHFDDKKVRNNQPTNVYSGIVIAGRRHHNCFYVLKELGLEPQITKDNTTPGFLTNLDRFVTRKEGFKIALNQNQILYPNLHTNEIDINFGNDQKEELNMKILTSEDLFIYNDSESL